MGAFVVSAIRRRGGQLEDIDHVRSEGRSSPALRPVVVESLCLKSVSKVCAWRTAPGNSPYLMRVGTRGPCGKLRRAVVGLQQCPTTTSMLFPSHNKYANDRIYCFMRRVSRTRLRRVLMMSAAVPSFGRPSELLGSVGVGCRSWVLPQRYWPWRVRLLRLICL